jgi:hypothetical protein
MRNTSQDPDYVGPVGHEKKLHKTHFEVLGSIKRTHPKDDPTWYEYAPGRWRKLPHGTQRRAKGREVKRGNAIRPDV